MTLGSYFYFGWLCPERVVLPIIVRVMYIPSPVEAKAEGLRVPGQCDCLKKPKTKQPHLPIPQRPTMHSDRAFHSVTAGRTTSTLSWSRETCSPPSLHRPPLGGKSRRDHRTPSSTGSSASWRLLSLTASGSTAFLLSRPAGRRHLFSVL